MTLLQQLVLPDTTFNAPDEMYLRGAFNDGVMLRRDKTSIDFFKGAKFSFDTFFSGLTVSLWQHSCHVDDVSLFLEGHGRVVIQLCLHTPDCKNQVLDEKELVLSHEKSVEFCVTEWAQLNEGILFPTVFAIEDGQITSGGWVTQTVPQRDVELAAVVTHFNRQQFVVPAMKRLKAALQNAAGHHISLFVVDNSNNLDAEEMPGVNVLPNRNLGGAGGFTRGLMEATDLGYTHCLFMDDDASCEAESVRRAYQLLSFSKSDKLAVAGALLRAREPNRLLEKGACFDGLVKPLKNSLDMTSAADLVQAERSVSKPDYGAWWFFAYNISQVEHMAFPFFVRGDDIIFGMLNDFDIVTANGIACWGEDFSVKSSPMSTYLDTRHYLVHQLSHLNGSVLSTIIHPIKLFISGALSYNYSSARCVSYAVRDVAQGSQFWVDNIDMSAVRKRISLLQPDEKLVPLDGVSYNPAHITTEETWLRKLVRLITLNGFLLPGFLLKENTVYQPKGSRGTFRQIFRHRHVLYTHEPSREGYFAQYDRKRFFYELFFFTKSLVLFGIKYSCLRRDYKRSVEKMTTRKFWDQVYFDDRI